MKHMKLLALLTMLIVLTFNSCKKEKKIVDEERTTKELPTKAIVGGGFPNISEVPYQVRITTGGSGGGGAIIGDRWILTAAHLVDGKEPSALTVYAGSRNLNSGDEYSVDSIFTKDYGGVGDNDIALLKLSVPITFSSNVAPIIYAIPEDNIALGQRGTASGWGQTSATETVSSLLKSTSLEVYNLSNPTEIEAKSTSVGPSGICFGDSGGPFKLDDPNGEFLVGISSFFPVGGGASYSASCVDGKSGFTRVSAFANWIKEKTGIISPRISGPSSFCDSATYSISNLPAGATVSWTISGSGTIAQNGNEAVATKIGGGVAFIRASVSYGSRSYSLARLINMIPDLNLSSACSYASIKFDDTSDPKPFCNDGMTTCLKLYNITEGGYYTAEVRLNTATPAKSMNIEIDSKDPSNAIIDITQIPSAGKWTIKTKKLQFWAKLKVTYSNECSSVIKYVTVTGVNGYCIYD